MKLVWIGRSITHLEYGNTYLTIRSPCSEYFWKLSNYEVEVSDDIDENGGREILPGSTGCASELAKHGYKVFLNKDIPYTDAYVHGKEGSNSIPNSSKASNNTWAGLLVLEERKNPGNKYILSKDGSFDDMPFVVYNDALDDYMILTSSGTSFVASWDYLFK